MSDVKNLYLELLYPGSFFPEESVIQVVERNPAKDARRYKTAYRLQYFEQASSTVKVDGKESIVYGPRRKESPRYFPGAQKFSVSQLEQLALDEGEPKRYDILISNVSQYPSKTAIRCRTGKWQPLDKGDEILVL